MKTVAIIQARMGSTRLPGKVMKLLAGKTILAHVIERVKACPLLSDVVVATTTMQQDDVIVAEAVRCGVKYFCGSKDDVLSRYYYSAKAVTAEIVVRITSDCPLFDPAILTKMLQEYFARAERGAPLDYYSNALQPTFPLGLSAEIFTFIALERAFLEATKDYEREHVTPYFYLHPDLFNIDGFTNAEDLSHYRLTLDTAEDFHLITEIYDHLNEEGRLFKTDAVIQLLKDRPSLAKINAHVRQKQLGD